MRNNAQAPAQAVNLRQLGVLRLRGTDAARFLQGQISNDTTRLTPEYSLLAGYHNPQGRVISVLRLLQLADADLLALLPRELIAPLMTRLRKYILRAKVQLSDDSAHWRIAGILPDATTAAQPGAAPDAARERVTRHGDSLQVGLGAWSTRALLLRPESVAGEAGAAPESSAALVRWRELAIAEGEAQVWPATSEAFVAQMLNLDVLGAIAFDKGCYTGQEVIARAHYRGRVKRRMQRFVTHQPGIVLQPGSSGTLNDGRTFKVVDAVPREAGWEFLAVSTLSADDTVESAQHGADPVADRHTTPLVAQQLPLPYSIIGENHLR